MKTMNGMSIGQHMYTTIDNVITHTTHDFTTFLTDRIWPFFSILFVVETTNSCYISNKMLFSQNEYFNFRVLQTAPKLMCFRFVTLTYPSLAHPVTALLISVTV